jgi:hypothetical protein
VFVSTSSRFDDLTIYSVSSDFNEFYLSTIFEIRSVITFWSGVSACGDETREGRLSTLFLAEDMKHNVPYLKQH